MVLHGDGSAHISKEDAFKPFTLYSDPRLKPAGDTSRSVPRSSYPPELCEQFDAIVSNPPFGITLSAEARASLSKTFSLPDTTPSEGLFIERCFQLLKPGGRLGVVLPESVLNAKEMQQVRLLIYRFFNIKAIVSLPRNIFIDTPTLTSLLFAEKKSKVEMKKWDDTWKKHASRVEAAVKKASLEIGKDGTLGKSATEISDAFLLALCDVVNGDEWISKGGKSPVLLPLKRDWTAEKPQDAVAHYREILGTAGFRGICQNTVFQKVASDLDYSFSAYEVDEVGYKLSKRREKARPNQLCTFMRKSSHEVTTNLHLVDAEHEVVVDTENPLNVLDYIRRDVVWGGV